MTTIIYRCSTSKNINEIILPFGRRGSLFGFLTLFLALGHGGDQIPTIGTLEESPIGVLLIKIALDLLLCLLERERKDARNIIVHEKNPL